MSQDSLYKLDSSRAMVGSKETLKAIRKNRASVVFLARDAEERVIKPIREECEEKGVSVEEIDSMKRLGKACGIGVGCAAVALLKE